MGANEFIIASKGKTATDAFGDAVDDAKYEYGHGGYSGTIAEKHEFVMIERRPEMSPVKDAEDLIGEGDPRIGDKWGPAGCFDLGDGNYLFFGMASS